MLNHHIRRLLNGGTLLAGEEITLVHVRHMGPARLAPNAHLVRVLLSICLYWSGDTAIRVTFAKDWVDSATKDGGITSLDCFLVRVFGFVGVQWNVVSFRAKLGNASVELRDGRRYVGQLNNNRIWLFA